MTEEEARFLSSQYPHEFYMYYGESKIGFLPELNGKFYLVNKKNYPNISPLESTFKKYGEEINLASISEYKPVYENNFRSFNVYQPKTIKSFEAKKMIILGAGASAGFSPLDEKFPDRPPLAFELFDDEYEKILEKFPGAKYLSGFTESGENLEMFFQSRWELIKKHYHPDLLNKIINTQYYLQYLFRDIFNKYKTKRKNNYNKLCDNILNYCVATNQKMIVTSFNYDTLFEQSLQNSMGYDYDIINDYIDVKRNVILYKPHGSWNWVRYFRGLIPYNNDKTDSEYFSKYIYQNKMDYHQLFKI